MQIWAESGKSALPICNYSQILYQFLTFTQNLKRSLLSRHFSCTRKFRWNSLVHKKAHSYLYLSMQICTGKCSVIPGEA